MTMGRVLALSQQLPPSVPPGWVHGKELAPCARYWLRRGCDKGVGIHDCVRMVRFGSEFIWLPTGGTELTRPFTMNPDL